MEKTGKKQETNSALTVCYNNFMQPINLVATVNLHSQLNVEQS